MHGCGKAEDLVKIFVLLVCLDGVEVDGHVVCLKVLQATPKVSAAIYEGFA